MTKGAKKWMNCLPYQYFQYNISERVNIRQYQYSWDHVYKQNRLAIVPTNNTIIIITIINKSYIHIPYLCNWCKNCVFRWDISRHPIDLHSKRIVMHSIDPIHHSTMRNDVRQNVEFLFCTLSLILLIFPPARYCSIRSVKYSTTSTLHFAHAYRNNGIRSVYCIPQAIRPIKKQIGGCTYTSNTHSSCWKVGEFFT